MRRQVPDGLARADAYVRYLPGHVVVDHSVDQKFVHGSIRDYSPSQANIA